jgi:hypothetical protein
MSCKTRVIQYVPKGYDYKAVSLVCGSTGIQGEPLFCEKCEPKNPQYCEHGRPLFPEDGRDIPCGVCEMQ